MSQGADQKPSERQWSVPCGYMTDPDASGNQYWVETPERLNMALTELQAVITRIGGVAQMGPVREKLSPLSGTGDPLPVQYVTTSIFVRWQSFAPAKPTAPAPESAAPEPEPAPS